MNNDNLKKFFDSHREAFDDRGPSGRVWRRIERALFGSRPINVWNNVMVWRAAAIILLGISLYLFLGQQTPAMVREDRIAQQEFSDVESYYSAQITEKVMFIRNDAGFEDDRFTQDFEKLEAMYAVLSEEMKKSPSQKVKDALVLNMLIRIDLLNQQIQRLEESREKKKSEV